MTVTHTLSDWLDQLAREPPQGAQMSSAMPGFSMLSWVWKPGSHQHTFDGAATQVLFLQ